MNEINTEEIFDQVKAAFEKEADLVKAPLMSKYLRNQFAFYGIQSQARKACYKEELKILKKAPLDWELVDLAWSDEHREFQYFACDYLRAKGIELSDLAKIKKLIVAKSWWDTIDSLIKPIGMLSTQIDLSNEMLAWSKDDNFWVRRAAIEHQLTLKDQTKPDLLSQIIINNLGSQEFFINKAIGWALRDYSKINPDWVSQFIETHPELSPLSKREASKYL